MIGDEAEVPKVDQGEEVKLWFKRIKAAEGVKETWEKAYRLVSCYQYWRGRQRDNEMDGSERKAQHNKIHPDVEEKLPSLYYHDPVGKVVAAPERSDTPAETVSQKAQLLQDTGYYLTREREVGFRDNTMLALKEAQWAFGCVEVGYSPDFISNPAAKRPPLKEKSDTKLGDGEVEGVDELGLSVDEGSDLQSVEAELKRLREMMRGETFFVRHIPWMQVVVSASDRPILTNNDWVGYWQDYPVEDVKASPAYENTEDLKASGGLEKKDEDGSVDRVRLWRIWDLRTKNKLVFAENHEKRLMKEPFERCPLKFYREDIDPNHFYPIPPVYLKLDSQDQYNDSAEYMRKMRLGTTPRYTYDEDAITPEAAAQFQNRDFGMMIPRKAGTREVIEPVSQPSTAGAAIQTLALAEKEFVQAGSASGNPLDPASQTATRAVIANTRKSAQESFKREVTAYWLSEIIEELIMFAVDNMNITRWIAINVDLDSPMAQVAALQVAKTYQMIDAEKLRSAVTGVKWTVQVEADSLSPVAETEKGMKLVQMINYLAQPNIALMLSKAPNMLRRMLSLAGFKSGEDLLAVKEALAFTVEMNMRMMAMGGKAPGVSGMPGEPAPPPQGTTAPPGAALPIPAGGPGA